MREERSGARCGWLYSGSGWWGGLGRLRRRWPSVAEGRGELGRGTTVRADTYTVVDGDTLSVIAERFDTAVEGLVAANELADADALELGSNYRFPGATSASGAREEAPYRLS